LADAESTWIVKLLRTHFQSHVEKDWAKGLFWIAVLPVLLLPLLTIHYPAKFFFCEEKILMETLGYQLAEHTFTGQILEKILLLVWD